MNLATASVLEECKKIAERDPMTPSQAKAYLSAWYSFDYRGKVPDLKEVDWKAVADHLNSRHSKRAL